MVCFYLPTLAFDFINDYNLLYVNILIAKDIRVVQQLAQKNQTQENNEESSTYKTEKRK